MSDRENQRSYLAEAIGIRGNERRAQLEKDGSIVSVKTADAVEEEKEVGGEEVGEIVECQERKS